MFIRRISHTTVLNIGDSTIINCTIKSGQGDLHTELASICFLADHKKVQRKSYIRGLFKVNVMTFPEPSAERSTSK